MINLKKKIQTYPDLFLKERSVTKRLSILLEPKHHNCCCDELIAKAIDIINLKDTIISKKKKDEYMSNFNKLKTKFKVQYYITNIVLTGSNLSMNSF